MATKSFITRLNALEFEYRNRIQTTFEKLRAIEVQPYFDEQNSMTDPVKTKIRKNVVSALSEVGLKESDVDFYDYGDEWKVSISFRTKRIVDKKALARKDELNKLIDEGRKKFCPIEKGYHRRLHEWKERCLVEGEIYSFESPQVDDYDKFDSIGCA